MTRIDFHSNIPDKFAYACRLIRKAHAGKSQVVVFLQNDAQLKAFDTALWTFSDHDFLPHVVAGDALASQTPIILTDDVSQEVPHHQVLINLSSHTPDYFARFERMIEVISNDEVDLAAGRERYKSYKQRGYPLELFGAKKT